MSEAQFDLKAQQAFAKECRQRIPATTTRVNGLGQKVPDWPLYFITTFIQSIGIQRGHYREMTYDEAVHAVKELRRQYPKKIKGQE